MLFGGHSLETAFRCIAFAGYDGIEISAIDGMSEHLVLDRWQEICPEIRRLSREYELPVLAMEQPSQDPERMRAAFQAAGEIGCPVVNCGPGGKTGDEGSFRSSVAALRNLGEMAERYGVTLCVKAHVGCAIYDTPTTLRLLDEVDHPSLALDMDPSHIHRAGENPVEALSAVVHRMGHVHIRDCKGRQQGPGAPELQVNGRGDIDLLGYFRVLQESGYNGPVNLEVIGAKDYDAVRCVSIAAEARGHMQACLQACGAR